MPQDQRAQGAWQAGAAFSLRSGDNTSLAFYRTHCIEFAYRGEVRSFCGLTLNPSDIMRPQHGEQACSECKAAIRERNDEGGSRDTNR
jgi:hypothetical protein